MMIVAIPLNLIKSIVNSLEKEKSDIFSYINPGFSNNKILINFEISIPGLTLTESKKFTIPIDNNNQDLKTIGLLASKMVFNINQLEGIEKIGISEEGMMIVTKKEIDIENLKSLITAAIRKANKSYLEEINKK